MNIVDPYRQEMIDVIYKSIDLRFFDTDISPTKFILQPGARILLSTREIIGTIPELTLLKDYIGDIALRSTWARLGLVIPPTRVDPGFEGNLTIAVLNSSSRSIILREGDALWHMYKIQVALGSEPMYEGRYQGSVGASIAKALKHGG